MAQYRQYGAERFSGRAATHDFGSGGDGGLSSEQISIRIPHKPARIRRLAGGRHDKGLIRASFPTVAAAFLLLGLVVTIFAFHYLSHDRDVQRRFDDSEEEERVDYRPLFNRTLPSRELRFGQGSVAGGRDSRYWDRDDRRRDDEYDEDGDISGISVGNENGVDEHKNGGGEMDSQKIHEVQHGKGLYNEAGRNELRKFEEKYKESLNNAEQLGEQGNGTEVNAMDEYDDGIDVEDELVDRADDQWDEEHQIRDSKIRKSPVQREVGNDINSLSDPFRKVASIVSLKSNTDRKMGHGHGGDGVGFSTKASGSKYKHTSKGKQKRRSSCEMKLLDASQLLEPLDNKKFSRFSLQYTQEENRPNGVDDWEPHFAGHQSLQEREESFYAHDQKINCGFVRGPEGSPSTGFDLAEDDVRFMSSCHIAVSSCIFGNSDHLRTPYTKTITRSSRKNVCFVMFMDEITLQTLSSEGQKPDSMGFIGLWKVVVVKNLPFDDMRRVGKVPKFLAHRLFPSARYSIWLDSKLRLQRDPLLILEYFLWRKGYEYAISNHYDRHCVWEEVLQNKKLNKFNHTIIDGQFAFYQADGLKRFDPLDPNRLLPSYVPEGSFIMRAHTPMSNLFSCLWFNEVDRFTPRDQLSFAYTYLKLRRTNPEKPFHLHMFKDCERRSIAKLFRHRGESKRNILTQAVV